MRRHRLIWTVAIVLSGCSLPAPYQTYWPNDPALKPVTASQQTQALVVYGATTTTPDMTPDSPEPESIHGPPGAPDTEPNDEPAETAVSAPPDQLVAICYSRIWNKPDAIKSAATQACGNGSARLQSQGIDLEACPLLTPTKAIFSCSAPGS